MKYYKWIHYLNYLKSSLYFYLLSFLIFTIYWLNIFGKKKVGFFLKKLIFNCSTAWLKSGCYISSSISYLILFSDYWTWVFSDFSVFLLLSSCLTYFEDVITHLVWRRENYRQLSEFNRNQIADFREGVFRSDIANCLNRNQSTVMRYYQSWTREGQKRCRKGTGGRRQTNKVQHRHLRLAVRDLQYKVKLND